MDWIFYPLLAVNTISFFMMMRDKHLARQGKWRISEKNLFLWALCFGAVGGTLGMFAFHHKTKHPKFRLGFPLLAVVQVVLVILLVRFFPG